MARDPLAKFNLDNIRSGSRFRQVSSTLERRGIGWKGALHDMKKPFRSTEFANLSKKDIQLGSEIIEDKLKHKAAYHGLNYHDVKDIHHKLENLRYAGKISRADEKDFLNISEHLKG